MKISDFKSIAVIQTAFLGDFVLSLPLFQVIRNNAPKSHISAVCTPVSSNTASLATAIDEIIPYDKRGMHRGYAGIKSLAERLKKLNTDLIIAPHRSFRTSLLAKLSGADLTVGFDKNACSFLYSKRAHYDINQHEILRNMSLLSVFEDVNRIYANVDLEFSTEDITAIENIFENKHLNENKQIVAIAPGSVWATKKWKLEHFCSLAKMLSDSGKNVVIIGAKDDYTDAEKIADESGAINLCGKTSIPQSIYLLKKTDLLITNDSAPTHFAGLVKCPTITLYGPTVPEFGFAPTGKRDRTLFVDNLKCRPCAIHGSKKCPLKHFECMNKLTPEYVFQNAKEILSFIHDV